jgi:hypothetical protein
MPLAVADWKACRDNCRLYVRQENATVKLTLVRVAYGGECNGMEEGNQGRILRPKLDGGWRKNTRPTDLKEHDGSLITTPEYSEITERVMTVS